MSKVTHPTRSLLQGMPYTNAANTDIRARFKAMAQKQEPAPNVTAIPKRRNSSARGL